MRIAMASDHAGYQLKEKLKAYLKNKGCKIDDFGTDCDMPVDYPDYIYPAARSVAEGNQSLGIVLGGSGNGEAMAARELLDALEEDSAFREQLSRLLPDNSIRQSIVGDHNKQAAIINSPGARQKL